MENKIQTVQQIYGEFGKGNVEGVLNLLHDDVSWSDSGYPEIPYALQRNGKKEVMNFFIELNNTVSFTQFEPRQFLKDGNFVVVKGFFAGKGNATEKTFESEWVNIWEVIDGKLKNFQAFIDTHKLVSALK